jgi:hypothetical protein
MFFENFRPILKDSSVHDSDIPVILPFPSGKSLGVGQFLEVDDRWVPYYFQISAHCCILSFVILTTYSSTIIDVDVQVSTPGQSDERTARLVPGPMESLPTLATKRPGSDQRCQSSKLRRMPILHFLRYQSCLLAQFIFRLLS